METDDVQMCEPHPSHRGLLPLLCTCRKLHTLLTDLQAELKRECSAADGGGGGSDGGTAATEGVPGGSRCPAAGIAPG